jgi:hypothetical protein
MSQNVPTPNQLVVFPPADKAVFWSAEHYPIFKKGYHSVSSNRPKSVCEQYENQIDFPCI